MTPGARTQAAIELMNQILLSWESQKRFPADKQLDLYFKGHRYIGSGDRGSIAELIYWILRHKATLEWWLKKHKMDDDGRSLVIAALVLRKDYTSENIGQLVRDSKYSIQPLSKEEQQLCKVLETKDLMQKDMPLHAAYNYPEWLEPRLKQSFGKDFEAAMYALNQQASTDLRANTLKTTREELASELGKENIYSKPSRLSSVGIRLEKRSPVFASPLFKKGWFEVQDEGSQLIASLVDAEPGHKVIDFCAGAGGKTLALAAAMKNKGRILAWDTSEKRLKQMSDRLRRAGVDNVQTHTLESENDPFIKRHKLSADRVLVDAPCSGTGTWRRNPDLKWRFTEKDLLETVEIQHSILRSAARLVKTGGRLIYATCSVLQDENERQLERFLSECNDFKVVCAEKIWDKSLPEDHSSGVSFLWVTPHQDGVDGFFAVALERMPDAKQPGGQDAGVEKGDNGS